MGGVGRAGGEDWRGWGELEWFSVSPTVSLHGQDGCKKAKKKPIVK